MSCPVGILVALRTKGKTAQAGRATNRGETVTPAGKQLMNVALVADVPNKLVFGGIENEMKSQSQFDNSEIRPKMAAVLCQDGDHFLPHFLGQDLQLFESQFFDL